LDILKPAAKAAVAAFHRMGLATYLVTGDTYSTALAVAEAVGIPATNIHASVSPQDKKSIIEKLQSDSVPVAMVGDGINDSPALATASVGIALSSGTDVAIEAADVVLMRPEDLLSVPASLCLARSIFTRIKLNILWACVYNAIGLPFAMGVFLPFGGISLHPMAAGAAMAASSVSVVLSSLLLKFWKRPGWLNEAKLEAEVNMGKIHAGGLGRRRRRGWSRFRDAVSRSPSQVSHLASEISRVVGWRARRTEDEGYVPLQTVEPAV
jgi:Cu+-exporting ATPase